MADKTWGRLDPEDLPKFVEEAIPAIKRTGIKVLEMRSGYASLRMPLAGNENHIGTMYAGVLLTLAEVPGGALFLSTFDATKYVPIVKAVEVRFKRPATTDVTITAELTPEEGERIHQELGSRGKSEFVLECELKDVKGEVVALSRADYQIRKSD